MLILLAQKQLHVFRHRPVDSNFRVVPHQAALVAGIVKPGAFINELRRFRHHNKSVGKALRHVKLLLVFRGKQHAVPLPIGVAALPQIHGNVVNLAADHPHQLALGVFLLKMKASEHTLFRLALVVLDKHHIQAGGFKIVIIIGLHEIASVVAEHLRLYHDKAFDPGFRKLKLSHSNRSSYPKYLQTF